MDAGQRAIDCFGRQLEQISQPDWRPQEVEAVSRIAEGESEIGFLPSHALMTVGQLARSSVGLLIRRGLPRLAVPGEKRVAGRLQMELSSMVIVPQFLRKSCKVVSVRWPLRVASIIYSLSNGLFGEIIAHSSRDFRTDRSDGRSSPLGIGFFDQPKSWHKRWLSCHWILVEIGEVSGIHGIGSKINPEFANWVRSSHIIIICCGWNRSIECDKTNNTRSRTLYSGLCASCNNKLIR
jgi:hypothetical protein